MARIGPMKLGERITSSLSREPVNADLAVGSSLRLAARLSARRARVAVLRGLFINPAQVVLATQG